MDNQADCRRVRVGGLYVIIMIAEIIWALANAVICIAFKFYYDWRLPAPQRFPALLVSVMLIFILEAAVWRVFHTTAMSEETDFENMDLKTLDGICAEMKDRLDIAYALKERRDKVGRDGWDENILREVMSGMDKETVENILAGNDAQRDLYNLFDARLRANLSPIMDLADDFVLWVEQNETKSPLCTIGEGGGLIPKRRLSTREPEETACTECGKKIEKIAPRYGVTYAEIDYHFCCPRCRYIWSDTGDGRKFRDAAEWWEEWIERDEASIYPRMQRVRIGYLARR